MWIQLCQTISEPHWTWRAAAAALLGVLQVVLLFRVPSDSLPTDSLSLWHFSEVRSSLSHLWYIVATCAASVVGYWCRFGPSEPWRAATLFGAVALNVWVVRRLSTLDPGGRLFRLLLRSSFATCASVAGYFAGVTQGPDSIESSRLPFMLSLLCLMFAAGCSLTLVKFYRTSPDQADAR